MARTLFYDSTTLLFRHKHITLYLPTSKMAVTLPYELLVMILDAHRNDYATLHSCVLVNRTWYGGAIQFLWAKPFTLLLKNTHTMTSSYRVNKVNNLLTEFVECFASIDDIRR